MEKENRIYKIIELDYLGKLNDQQKAELDVWMNESPEHLQEYQEVKKVLKYSERLNLMYRINTSNDLLTIKNKIKEQTVVHQLYQNFQKIAAILIIPLLLYSVWSGIGLSGSDQNNGILKSTETAFGVRTQIELSDGTKIWLNSGSKLSYPDEFDGKTRQVKLLGEAYFQVKSDKKHPFYVDLGGYMIKATGTSFNIANYENENQMSTFLESGKVSLVGFRNNKEKQLSKLEQGQQIVLNKAERKFRVQKADGEKHLSWINGKLIFRNDNMLDVAQKLGRWFNADIEFEGAEMNEYLFTATFENESLEEALKLLSYSSPIAFTITQGNQKDDSSFSKRKVIITKTQ